MRILILFELDSRWSEAYYLIDRRKVKVKFWGGSRWDADKDDLIEASVRVDLMLNNEKSGLVGSIIGPNK